MTKDEANAELVHYWLKQADECLASASRELEAGAIRFALNRAYYACFYAVSAALQQEGRSFKKHTGVRDALHSHLIRPGRLDTDCGKTYDDLFRIRGEVDYVAFTEVDASTASERIQLASELVSRMKAVIFPSTT